MAIKRKTKNKIKKLVKACYWVVLFLCAFVVLGTLLYFIPLLSDLASMLFLPVYILWLVLSVLLVAASAIFFKRKHSKRRLSTLILSCTILVSFVFMSAFTVAKVNAQGEHISFIKNFVPAVFSEVKEENTYYIDQNNEKIGLSVFYVDDGAQNKPVMFYTHGGGWIMGDRYNRLQTSKTFAQKGFVVISVDYDLSGDDEHLYNFTEKQLLCAVKWAEEHAADFHGDIEKLFMTGDSAGGNLALNLAYKISSGDYAGYPQVVGVSVLYPVVDIRDFYDVENVMTASSAKKMAVSYMGAIPENEAGRYAEHNPENFVGDATPPTLVVLGTDDSSVTPKDTYKFCNLLTQKGVENKLVKIPFANHSGDFYVNNFMGQAYVNNTLTWFENLGAFE